MLHAHRQTSYGVDLCNQLALQLREPNRKQQWGAVVHALVVRFAAGNTYTASNNLGVGEQEMTMAEF